MEEVTENMGCESANAQVLQMSEICEAVSVASKKSWGTGWVHVDFWWHCRPLLTLWAPLLSLLMEVTRPPLSRSETGRYPAQLKRHP